VAERVLEPSSADSAGGEVHLLIAAICCTRGSLRAPFFSISADFAMVVLGGWIRISLHRISGNGEGPALSSVVEHDTIASGAKPYV
jgi:hypothetical protein